MLATLESANQSNGLGSGYAAGFNPTKNTTQQSTSSSSNNEGSAPPSQEVQCTREHLRLAIEIVSDYLTDEWAKKVLEHFNITKVSLYLSQGQLGSHRTDGPPSSSPSSSLLYIHTYRRKPSRRLRLLLLRTRGQLGMSKTNKTRQWSLHMARYVARQRISGCQKAIYSSYHVYDILLLPHTETKDCRW